MKVRGEVRLRFERGEVWSASGHAGRCGETWGVAGGGVGTAGTRFPLSKRVLRGAKNFFFFAIGLFSRVRELFLNVWISAPIYVLCSAYNLEFIIIKKKITIFLGRRPLTVFALRRDIE